MYFPWSWGLKIHIVAHILKSLENISFLYDLYYVWDCCLIHSFLQSPSEDYVCDFKYLPDDFPQITNTLTQETVEKMQEIFSSEVPTLTPYLTSSSTSTSETMSKLDDETWANVESSLSSFFFFVFIMQQRSQHESCDHTIYNNVLPHDSCLSCWHEPLTFKCSSLLQITTLQLIFIQSSLRFDTRFVVRFTQICHQTAMSCTTEGHESAASTPSDLTEQCRSWPFVTWAKVLSH